MITSPFKPKKVSQSNIKNRKKPMRKIFFTVFIFSLNLKAQVILVPSKEILLETYLQKCKVEGYLCTQDYFKNKIATQKSEKYDQFVENLDLYSEDYRKSLLVRFKAVLAEDLSLDQVDLLIKIISRFETIDKNITLSQIKNELKELSLDVQNMFEEKSESETYILFGKFLTKKQYLSIKFKQKYTHTKKITPFTEPQSADQIRPVYLIQGECENYEFSSGLKERRDLHFTALFENECGLTRAFSGQSSFSEIKWKNYEKPLIYTAAAAVLITLLNQYQVEVTF